MKLGKKGLKLIKEFEGLKLRAYQDTGGVWTIGYGHTRNAKPGLTITEKQATKLLVADVYDAEKGVERATKVDLTQNEFDALVSFTFNLGVGQLLKSTLLKKLNRGDKEGAADEFLRWVYDNGKKLRGLERRREAERVLFLTKEEK